MENFDLEREIACWRRKLSGSGSFEEGHLEELEMHLRDMIEDLHEDGKTDKDAYRIAMERIGSTEFLSRDNRGANDRKVWRQARRFMPDLWIHYLKTTVRLFRKKVNYNLINFICLSLGLACSGIIALYVNHELSYDSDYRGKPVFRVIHQRAEFNGELSFSSTGPVNMGGVLADEIAGIKATARFWRAFRPTVNFEDNIFEETKLMFTDTTVFSIFEFTFVRGGAKSAFKIPNSVILTEETATRYFGEQDPMGKVLDYSGYPGNDLELVVAGVLEDLPGNTHFDFDMLASFEILREWDTNWGSFKPVWTYVELSEETEVEDVQIQFDGFVEKYLKSRKETDPELAFYLEPVSSIHLSSKAQNSMSTPGSWDLLLLLTATGILMLVMSCINFINTSLARAFSRMKEVGIRKALGAQKSQLIRQFISEITLIVVLASLGAFLLVVLFRGFLEGIIGFPIDLSVLMLPGAIPVLSSLLVLTVVLAGLYPAVYMSGINILDAIKNRLVRGNNWFTQNSLQKGLLYIQLVLVAGLVMSILVMRNQLDYIKDKDLGVVINQVVAIPWSENFDFFDNEVSQLPGVKSHCYSQVLPVNTLNHDGRIIETPEMKGVLPVRSSFVTPGFKETYSLALLAGRFFDSRLTSDTSKFILNETAVRQVGWSPEEAVGKEITWSHNRRGEVIGVVNDFHLESIHTKIEPTVLLYDLTREVYWNLFISVKFEKESETDVVTALEKKWKEVNPERPFRLIYLDESYEKLHSADFRLADTILLFMVIAVFISLSGLYGLSSYTIEKRNKEIGIRRIMGSSPFQLIVRLGKSYLILAIAAFILAVPLVLFLMRSWLEEFAYSAPIRINSLLLGGLIVIGIVILTVVQESWRAASTKPSKYLRSE